MYFHQIEGVEFIYDSHEQTFFSTLYKLLFVYFEKLFALF